MQEHFLILETSHRRGHVALASADEIIGSRPLEESRRHARDLAPKVRELLQEAGCKARDLAAVIVSRGPGSYTGLRVGIMSAKTLAYATGCPLLGVETFAAIARQAPAEAQVVDVLADAQQDKVYVQRFVRGEPAGPAAPLAGLSILPFTSWLEDLPAQAWATGPGLEVFGARLAPGIRTVESGQWLPRPESLLDIGLERLRRGERDDPFVLEPLYLRPSAAEEKLRTST